jgi:hypothetical protein
MWNHANLMTEDRAILINAVGGGAKIGDYTGFPLTEAGRQWVDSWMMARMEMPEHQCHPHPAQYSFWKAIGCLSSPRTGAGGCSRPRKAMRRACR